ncbi:hypothetical protein FRC06_005265 [Ceratobasidium sp. 370]|nr:hypothetical protein FRC06_005265 [Ceratobasidium sp. 370]
MAEQLDSESHQHAPHSRAPTSQPMPVIGAVPNAGTPGNRQDNSEPRCTDGQAEEPATGTSEPEDGLPTGWNRDNLPNGATMDVDWHSVGPQAGHVVGRQHLQQGKTTVYFMILYCWGLGQLLLALIDCDAE